MMDRPSIICSKPEREIISEAVVASKA